MNLKTKMSFDEFDKCDIKYDIYSELYESCKHLISQNDKQYCLLESKDKMIQKLKDIIISIIENISE